MPQYNKFPDLKYVEQKDMPVTLAAMKLYKTTARNGV